MHLPCSFSLTSPSSVARHLGQRTGFESLGIDSVCAPFEAYPWQKRNLDYFRIKNKADRLGLRSFFGTARGGARNNDAIIRTILDHHVVVNLSLKDDLNMRNFEALALNRILLTNKVEDHSIFEEFSQNIVFFSPGLFGLEDDLKRALSKEPTDISEEFLLQHGMHSRLSAIILRLSGVELSPKDLCLKMRCADPDFDSTNLRPKDESISAHTPELLIGRSGWSGLRPLGANGADPAVRLDLLAVFAFWSISFMRNVLARTFGSIPTFRAGARFLGILNLMI